MPNRNAPARAFGNAGADNLNHATAKQKSKVTGFDPSPPNSQVRLKGGKSPEGAKSVTGAEATDLFTSAAHGYLAGDELRFSGMTGGAGIVAGTSYYVIATSLATNTFKVSATPGGSSIDFTTDLTAGTVRRYKYTYVGGANVHQGRVLPEVPGPRKGGRVS